MDTARDEGKIEGKIEGKMEGKMEAISEMAKKLLIKGIPIETIIHTTGLSADEINNL